MQDNQHSILANPQIKTVPFHGANLVTALHNNEPYAAMKPIVEGMGLSWQAQHRKLCNHNSESDAGDNHNGDTPDRWGIREILIPSAGGDQQTICMPIRKLPGWLMTIHPNKIKNPDVRAKVIMYQNECDDVLWQYWHAKQTAMPRQYPGDKLTPAQLRTLQEAVAHRTEGMTDKARASAFPKLWGAIKSHFHVPSYRELPPEQYDEALSLVGRIPLDGEYLPKQDDGRTKPSSSPIGDTTDKSALMQEVMRSGRFCMSFDHTGKMQMREIPCDTVTLRPEELPSWLADSIMIESGLLLNIASACISKLNKRGICR